MKKVNLGTFYAQKLILEDEENQERAYSEKEWQKMYENWIGSIKGMAVEEYKDELLLEKAEKHIQFLKNESYLHFIFRYYKEKIQKLFTP